MHLDLKKEYNALVHYNLNHNTHSGVIWGTLERRTGLQELCFIISPRMARIKAAQTPLTWRTNCNFMCVFCRENDLRIPSGKFLRIEFCHSGNSDFLGLWYHGSRCENVEGESKKSVCHTITVEPTLHCARTDS